MSRRTKYTVCWLSFFDHGNYWISYMFG